MATTSDLAVVICHGSYHTPAPYMPLVQAQRDRGIEAYCPQLPTADLTKLNVGDVAKPDFDQEPPTEGYPQGDQDAAVILDVVRPLVEHGKRVLMVRPLSRLPFPSCKQRPKMTKEESSEFSMLAPSSFRSESQSTVFFQPNDGPPVVPPFMRFHRHGAAGLAEASKWADTLTASPILTTKLTNNAYASLPCAYLVLEGDLTLPKQYQDQMAALQGQKTGPFTMYRCQSGHSPHLSWTSGFVDTIQDFVGKIEV
ncbi:putative AB hydrolase-1 domain-containing protein [Seiridium cardinale]|uniref:AB hydrolase-1 domain-containing protein n=1 Tax=Seiridium cardinale TaxID=138064 RepID=A0ABR2XQX3_9PEZI